MPKFFILGATQHRIKSYNGSRLKPIYHPLMENSMRINPFMNNNLTCICRDVTSDAR